MSVAAAISGQAYAALGGGGPSGNDAFTTMLLHLDGSDAATTVIDSSASALSFTAAGDAQLDTAEKKFGTAAGLFDGTGDYFTTPANSAFEFGSAPFTVDLWFNRAGGDGTNRCMIGQVTAALGEHNFQLVLTSGNVLRFDTAGPTVTGTTTITAAGWHHAAIIRTGDILRLFLNGVQEGGDVAKTGDMTASTGNLSIGRWGAANSQYWNGWIDEVRISKGIARWTSNFTPPISPYGP